MNRILKLTAFLAVGSASVAVYAQSDMSAPGATPYGKFRPLEKRPQEVAAEQPAPQSERAPEAPQSQPPQAKQPATASTQVPALVQPPMRGAPYGYGPSAEFGPSHVDPFGADSWARYEQRKRFMRDRQMFRRYAPRRGYRRYSRFGAPYGPPGAYHGPQQQPAAPASAEGGPPAQR